MVTPSLRMSEPAGARDRPPDGEPREAGRVGVARPAGAPAPDAADGRAGTHSEGWVDGTPFWPIHYIDAGGRSLCGEVIVAAWVERQPDDGFTYPRDCPTCREKFAVLREARRQLYGGSTA